MHRRSEVVSRVLMTPCTKPNRAPRSSRAITRIARTCASGERRRNPSSGCAPSRRASIPTARLTLGVSWEESSVQILMLGASGFVGRHLSHRLKQRGDTVVEASLRDPEAAASVASGCDAIVNLAGEPIAQHWNDDVKRRIEQSRVDAPRRFLDALAQRERRCRAYVSASAVGYYGTSETETFVEESSAGEDFLARVCVGWEREACRASDLGMRVAIVRTGVALGADGGALQKMLPPFYLGLGGVIGSGRQWISWVHVADLVGIYLTALDGAEGPLNACAPNPVTNAQFTHALGE